MTREETKEIMKWVCARDTIADVETESTYTGPPDFQVRRVSHIGHGGKVIVGRHVASRIMKALDDAGYKIVRKDDAEEL